MNNAKFSYKGIGTCNLCANKHFFFYFSKTRDKYTILSLYALHHPLNGSHLKRTNNITNLLQTKNGRHQKHTDTPEKLGHSPIRTSLRLHLIG